MTLREATPAYVRSLIKEDKLVQPTSGFCPGYAQANMVVLPKELAFDFLVFAQRNPKPCPILEVMEPGRYISGICAKGDDIRFVIPKYRVYQYGEPVAEVTNIEKYWRDDLVTFFIGCSFTFEAPLMEAGIPIRHIEENCNVPMYITNIRCNKAGIFEGPMVVSMRPIHYSRVVEATLITAQYPAVHGAPVHIGDPSQIGIKDINKPDFGDAVTIKEDEVPVFWACGVTPQAVAMEVKPELLITHSPGHMLITDIKNKDLANK
ncbi:MAG: putative hydro-lyase [Clostridia bacterium]|nr:putative hydro-lyase [Clostridia bacterium]